MEGTGACRAQLRFEERTCPNTHQGHKVSMRARACRFLAPSCAASRVRACVRMSVRLCVRLVDAHA
eukprot:4126494-Pleurochrysis_carterae.AAC.1